MQEHVQMEVAAREERGKNAARRMRAGGRTPASLYGLSHEPQALSIDTKAALRLLTSRTDRNRVLELKGAAKGLAMARDWQTDPVTGRLLHIDFRRVDLDKPIILPAPIVTTGVSYGAKNEGGLEDVILREVKVECRPDDIPEKIEVNITQLRAGQSIRVRDLELGEQVRVLGNPDAVIVRVVGKRTGGAEETEQEAAAAPAE